MDVKREGVRTLDLVQVSKELISKYVEERDIIKVKTINEQIQNIAQKKDTLCRRMYN